MMRRPTRGTAAETRHGGQVTTPPPPDPPAPDPTPFTESDRTFQAFFECNPQPMFLLDLQAFRYLAVENAALGLYGYTRVEFLALDQTDLRVKDEADQLLDDRAALTRGHKKHFRDTRH